MAPLSPILFFSTVSLSSTQVQLGQRVVAHQQLADRLQSLVLQVVVRYQSTLKLHKVKELTDPTPFKDSRKSRTGLSSLTCSDLALKDTEDEVVDLGSEGEDVGNGGDFLGGGLGEF